MAPQSGWNVHWQKTLQLPLMLTIIPCNYGDFSGYFQIPG